MSSKIKTNLFGDIEILDEKGFFGDITDLKRGFNTQIYLQFGSI